MAIAPSSRLSADEVTRRTFTTERKGFTQSEVRAFLDLVARELETAAARERELREALSVAEHRAANPVLDEATLTTAIGQETAKVLRSAHDAAAELVAKAEKDADRLRAEASDQGQRLRAEAAKESERLRAEASELSERLRAEAVDESERVRAEAAEESEQVRSHAEQIAGELQSRAETDAEELRTRADTEATARLEAATADAESMLTQSRSQCRAMVQEAQEMRTRILSDLTRRRRVLHSQIEQLRAGRDRLAETMTDVRHTVDQVTDELFRAEDEARVAAEEAGRQAAAEGVIDDGLSVETALPGTADPVAEQATELVPADLQPEEEERRQQAVDELFARLRAQQEVKDPATEEQPSERQETNGQEPRAQTQTAERKAPAAGREEPRAGKGGTGEGVTVLGPVPPTEAPGSSTLPAGGAPAAVAVVEQTGAADAPADSGTDEGDTPDPLLARRDALLGPAAAALARRLKRAIADDQNDILDRLRALGSFGPQVLASEDEQAKRYRDAADGQLVEAAHAGAVFGGGSPDDAPSVEDLSSELAANIVAPLRRRLLEEPAPLEDDESAMVEHIGSAYREWKGQRVERVARDHAHAAFSRAVLAVTPEGRDLRWLVDDDSGQCPDCDDNALAGALPRGEAFPTGHVHPPAHPGCRCLLVPGQA